MPGKLQRIESALSEQWGSALPAAVPDLVYQISRILTLWGRTDASLPDLWQQLDSLLFNTIYLATERTMTVILDNGQRLRVTSGGEAVWADEYDIAVQPEDALEVMTAGDGALYLLPRKAGEASVTLTERGVENPKSAVLQVTVRPLTGQPMLWLCAAGAALCLIGLTAAIVILIGKRAQGSAKER